MKNELDAKTRIDSLNWETVIQGLEGKTTFTDFDIKRSLAKTGRTFNTNGVFYQVVSKFIASLGNTVTTRMEGGIRVYQLSSTESALEIVRGRRKTAVSQKQYDVSTLIVEEPKNDAPIEEKSSEVKLTDEEKIKASFSNGSKSLFTCVQQACYILAIYARYGKKELSSVTIQSDMTELGVNWSSFYTAGRPKVREILHVLGLYEWEFKRNSRRDDGSTWILNGNTEILDGYMKLVDLYKSLTGNDPKNLDDFVTTESTEAEAEDRLERVIEERAASLPRNPRDESNNEVIWQKYLLIESLRENRMSSPKLAHLLSWIEKNRYFSITEDDAKTYLRELAEDTEGKINYRSFEDRATISNPNDQNILSFYNPAKLTETVYVMVKLTPQEMSAAFPGIDATLEETTVSGGNIYRLALNRSFQVEIELKKLIRFIQISGKIYTENSWMISRASEIIRKEDAEMRKKNTMISSLQP